MGEVTLARVTTRDLTTLSDLLQEYGVRIRFVGLRHLFPEEVQSAVKRMEQMTAQNRRYIRAEVKLD